MKRPDYSAIGRIMELLEESPELRRLAWACIVAVYGYIAVLLIAAIRWW